MTEVRHHAVTVPATSANLGPGFDAFGLALRSRDPRAPGVAALSVRSVPRHEQTERVVTVGEGAGEVATGDDNLVWRSLVRFCDQHDVPVPDVGLRAANGIPFERGLGSSSAAIVAGLALGRALSEVRVGDRGLVELATAIEGHPDNVGPAILGGVVACAPDDAGGLVIRRINPAPSLRPLVLVPAERQATTAARAVLPTHLERSAVIDQAARAGHVLVGLAGAWPVDAGLAGDRLHEPDRFVTMPGTGAAVTDLRAAGIHAWLSGAGPAVAAFTSGRAADLDAVVDEVAARHGFEVHHLAVDLTGLSCCPADGCAVGGSGDCVQCPRRRV